MSYDSKPPSIGLWKSHYDRGPFASGNCGNIRFVLWENADKRGDNSPDFRLVMEAPQKREDRGAGPGEVDDGQRHGGGGIGPVAARPEADGGGSFAHDDEIAFMMEWR